MKKLKKNVMGGGGGGGLCVPKGLIYSSILLVPRPFR